MQTEVGDLVVECLNADRMRPVVPAGVSAMKRRVVGFVPCVSDGGKNFLGVCVARKVFLPSVLRSWRRVEA